MAKYINSKKVFGLIIIFILVNLIFVPINYKKIFVHGYNDYPDHIGYAISLEKGEEIPKFQQAHPMWQYSVILVRKITHLGVKASALIVQSGILLLLALVLFWYVSSRDIIKNPLWVSLGVLAVLIAAPIPLLYFQDKLAYLGYIGINVYHNSSITMLKPFALVLFFFAIDCFDGKKASWMTIIISSVVTILSALIKPNYLICILPVLACMTLYKLFKKQYIDWLYLVCGVFLPSSAVLLWQFWMTYGEDQGIILAPFAVMRGFSDFLFVKFILSIWFPLLLSILFFKKVWSDKGMILAWSIFGMGAFQTYFLAEEGNRFMHANFGWSGEITLFILFCISGISFIRFIKEKKKIGWIERAVIYLGFAPQVIAGIVYYIYCFTENTFV